MILTGRDGGEASPALLRIVYDDPFNPDEDELLLFWLARPIGVARRSGR